MYPREFGGYLPLELPRGNGEFYNSNKDYDVLALNSGRATFYYIAKINNIKKIYLPIFTCAETSTPFKDLNIEIEYYTLDDDLLPKGIHLRDTDFILWTNYYGNANDKQIDTILRRYKNLIIDNCHAFFSLPRKGAFNCYSARKFFGVSDGAYLIYDDLKSLDDFSIGYSHQNCQQLLRQIDEGVNAGYKDNLVNEDRIRDNYYLMSNLTKRILQSIDYKTINNLRRRNFLQMHKFLGKINQFNINLNSHSHMYYPFLIPQEDLRYKLIQHKLYNPFWWKHVMALVPSNTIEYKLSKFTIMLPIDQRYNDLDIQSISELVLQNITI